MTYDETQALPLEALAIALLWLLVAVVFFAAWAWLVLTLEGDRLREWWRGLRG